MITGEPNCETDDEVTDQLVDAIARATSICFDNIATKGDGVESVNLFGTICESECGTIGTGICTNTCEAPTGDDCTPPIEICNDFIDNDCDNFEDCTDEDCVGDFSCGA